MRKKLRNISLVSLLLIYIVLNLILFITVEDVIDNQLSNPAFWITWIFTFPVNLIILLVGYFYTGKSNNDDEILIPPLVYIILTFNVIYLTSGMISSYKPAAIYDWRFALIYELIVTVVYIIAVLFVTFGISYIRGNQKYTKKKVMYIRELWTSLEVCYEYVENQVVLAKLKQLAEDIRFSDPMTHESLGDIEAEISVLVDTICNEATSKNIDALPELIDQASAKLKFRNAKCKILK